MIFKFRCPKCDIRLTVAEHKAGQASRCPSCEQPIEIPQPRAEDLVASPKSATVEPAAVSTRTMPPPSVPVRERSDAALPGQSDGEQSIPRNEPTATTAAVRTPGIVELPRWVVYTQAGLLVIVASTFFVLGMMTRQLGGGSTTISAAQYACQLTGSVRLQRGDETAPDEGAVVIVVPADKAPSGRPNLRALRPDSFEPLDNPAIELVESIGGRVVRINRSGTFDLSLQGPLDVHVLIISRGAARPSNDPLPKSQVVAIGRYFFPVEELLGSQQFHWTSLKLNRESQAIPPVIF